jgi:cytochrome c-type biogenesis protein CcmE
MKKTHIAALIFIVIAIGAIITTVYDADTYADFTQARNNPGREYHIIGALNYDKPVTETIENNALVFSFYMFDEKGVESYVVHYGPRPQDFEKLEQIVLIGQFKDDMFVASQMLLKCPSKYQENEFPDDQEVISLR